MSFRIGETGLAMAKVWHLVDAREKILGKLAQRVSIALRGKYKPIYSPAVDHGDWVVVINARHVALTEQKMYRWHTQYPGGLQELTYPEFLKKHPNGPVEKAVYGMLPKNNLRKLYMKRLLVYPDADHPHEANIMKCYDTEYERVLREQMDAAEEEMRISEEKRLLVKVPTSASGMWTGSKL